MFFHQKLIRELQFSIETIESCLYARIQNSFNWLLNSINSNTLCFSADHFLVQIFIYCQAKIVINSAVSLTATIK